MTQTMKGLLKGLRYISQIFDAEEEKEEEIQIGMPTDVKHVSHIGWDGPSSASPSWMNEYPAPTESSSGPLEAKGTPATISSNKDIADMQKASDAPLDSPTRRNKGKQSKRNNTSSNGSVGSPSRDPSGISKPRRPKSSALGSESPSQDPSGATKKSNRKKTKGSSGGGSTRPSRSKGSEDQIADNFPFSDPGPDYGPKDDGIKSVFDKGNDDEISRGSRGL